MLVAADESTTEFLGTNPAALSLPRIGSYRLVRQIGEGGMGTVFEAVQESLERRVAVKVLSAWMSTQERHVQRFEREAKLAARLEHPNIIRVYEFGRHEKVFFIVMEFIEGHDLRQILADPTAARTGEEWAAIFVPALRALQYAHDAGMVHRDLKPANIMVDRQGKVLLADFGLARAFDTETLTRTGEVIGTVQYMAPECLAASDEREVSVKSDVYSMGVSLYECLTRGHPYELSGVRNLAQLLHALQTQEPAPPSRQSGQPVDSALERVVMQAIQKDPRDRYATAAEFADDLERYLRHEPPQARVRRWPALARRAGRLAQHRLTTMVVGLVMSLLTVGAGWMLVRLEAAQDEARAAIHQASGLRAREFALRIENHLGRAQAALAQGRLDAAASELRAASFLAPRHAEVLELSGQVALRRSAWKEAVDLYKQALAARQTEESFVGLSRARQAQGENVEALADLERAGKLWPRSARLAFETGRLMAVLGHSPAALGALERAASLGLRSVELYEQTAAVAGKLGRPAAAIERYQRLAKLQRRVQEIAAQAPAEGPDPVLMGLASPDLVSDLAELLASASSPVACAAAQALGECRSMAVAEPLIGALSATDPRLRHAANEGLRGLSGRSFGFEPLAAQAARQEGVRAWTAWLEKVRTRPYPDILAGSLAEQGIALPAARKARLAALAGALDNREWWVRLAAYRLLVAGAGTELPFDARGEERLRTAQAAAWKHWVASQPGGGG